MDAPTGLTRPLAGHGGGGRVVGRTGLCVKWALRRWGRAVGGGGGWDGALLPARAPWGCAAGKGGVPARRLATARGRLARSMGLGVRGVRVATRASTGARLP